ncbi:MAG: hypothetical protein DHS20C20_33770 [Ardenticatenaceae bacterium]|nr:MAG: hypothetical protein DHS20C20_33770 [Ardenticatenaceae bacterium]
MNQKITILFVLVLAVLLLAACSSPSKEYEAGEVLLTESFNSASAWETYVSDTVDFQVNDGVYRVQTEDGGYIWGLNEAEHDDVVIEVTSTQDSSYDNNAYGVMCRSDTSNNGDGYYFLISGDGYYSISKGEGEDVNQLVEWTSSSAINEGQASNTIRAVCIDNYLALYVNDKFLAEVEDSDFSSGYAGFAATAFDGGDTDISFDNLTITAASLSN